MIHDGQPLAADWLEDFSVVNGDAVSLLLGAPHPNAAKVFLNWLFTTNGQTLWRDTGQMPTRADMSPAEDWMKGVTRSKERLDDAYVPDAKISAVQKELADYFKK